MAGTLVVLPHLLGGQMPRALLVEWVVVVRRWLVSHSGELLAWSLVLLPALVLVWLVWLQKGSLAWHGGMVGMLHGVGSRRRGRCSSYLAPGGASADSATGWELLPALDAWPRGLIRRYA